MNVRAGKIEGFGEFSQFESLEEFNHPLEQRMAKHKDAFSTGRKYNSQTANLHYVKYPH
jgi:hypothetical protein